MKPILFNTGMVRAIQADRKTVTRRVVKPQPREIYHGGTLWEDDGDLIALIESLNGMLEQAVSPYRPGGILYVRETWATWIEMRKAGEVGHLEQFYYKANGDAPNGIKWRPSIQMPREAARIFLRVTDVRVERLQDIDDDGIVAEGMNIGDPFDELWNNTIKPADRALYGWDANPWVWVIEFERISREEGKGSQ